MRGELKQLLDIARRGVSVIAPGTYVIDLQNSLNKQRIRDATPNDPVVVLVYREGHPDGDRVVASGLLSADKKAFRVTVQTRGGEDCHDWSYGLLCAALA
jgi:hypothetical protein